MSDPTVRTTAGVPRADLRAAFGTNPRLIKAFENLFEDVATILPEATGTTSTAAAVAQESADDAQALATIVQAIASQALRMASDQEQDPGIGAIQAELASLRSRISALEQGTTP